ncbi:MAG: hypothetical protein SGI73_07365 [Chloroflexota bacterium]|nr:hypothetical protein [Chloroflexota bacterium]
MATRTMDAARVREMAKEFDDISKMLTDVDKALDGDMDRLVKWAFVGAVGVTMAQNYLNVIQPFVIEMVKKYTEMANDARESARLWEEANK